MSLSSLMSFDRMTVRTPHLALSDFCLRLSETFCVTHIEQLVANMIKVKRVRVRLVPAIYATGRHLVCIQPAPDDRGTFIGNSVHALSIPWLLQSSGSPFFDLFLWSWKSDTRPVLAQGRAELSRPFCSKCATALLAFKRLVFN